LVSTGAGVDNCLDEHAATPGNITAAAKRLKGVVIQEFY
jgi:hypothetical protein